MTQKVQHHHHNKNVITIKIGDLKKKKRRKSKSKSKKHHLIQQPHLPPYSSVIPNPVSSQINRPYYVETSSIHPLMLDQNKAKSVDVKDLITAPEPPPALLPPPPPPPTAPETQNDNSFRNTVHEYNNLVSPENQIDYDQELQDLHNATHSNFTDQYNEPYNETASFDDQSKETEHGVRLAGHPRGKKIEEYEKELKNQNRRSRYAMDPKVVEKKTKKQQKKEEKAAEAEAKRAAKAEEAAAKKAAKAEEAAAKKVAKEEKISLVGGGAGSGPVEPTNKKKKKSKSN